MSTFQRGQPQEKRKQYTARCLRHPCVDGWGGETALQTTRAWLGRKGSQGKGGRPRDWDSSGSHTNSNVNELRSESNVQHVALDVSPSDGD